MSDKMIKLELTIKQLYVLNLALKKQSSRKIRKKFLEAEQGISKKIYSALIENTDKAELDQLKTDWQELKDEAQKEFVEQSAKQPIKKPIREPVGVWRDFP